MDGQARHRVVIIGGGFGGLYAARKLRKAGDLVDVTLDRPAQPPPVPAAALPGRDRRALARATSRSRCARSSAASGTPRVLLAEAIAIDAGEARGAWLDGGALGYDYADRRDRRAPLVLRPRRLGARRARASSRIDDALEIRRRILIAFEAAERESDPERAARVADLRDRRRRPDRRRARGRARRDRPRHPRARLPLDPTRRSAGSSWSRRGPDPAHVSRRAVGVGAAASWSGSASTSGRRPRSSTSTTRPSTG